MEIKPDSADYVETRLEHLFESCAAKYPENCAIRSPQGDTSYAQLNSESNQLARCLSDDKNIINGAVVTLVESNLRQIEAQVGILKAQAYFVCLDPCHPSERLLGILKETLAVAMIVDESIYRHQALLNYICELDISIYYFNFSLESLKSQKQFVSLDAAKKERSGQNLSHSGSPDDIAYIAYTSGSTGEPKGIVQSHRSFCQFLQWQSREFKIGPKTLLIQWASISYDASFCEIFGTLCFAGTLCVESPQVRFNPLLLVQWLRKVQPHILQIVPSFCRQVIEILEDGAEQTDPLFRRLEYLLLAGEALSTDLALAWKDTQKSRLYNLYGPSETVLATSHEFIEQDINSSMVPIGKPIDGRQMLILDEQQNSVPIGQSGELYIQSQFLSMGYLNRRQETASRFIQNPITKKSEQHHQSDPVFRTGDIVRMRADGELEFVGRKDNLVKLRGMRVELGEIESVIRRQVGILECVARVCNLERQQDRLTAKDRRARHVVASGSQFLAAYVTTNHPVEPSKLRAAVCTQLPVHMVPQQFIFLDAMPVNANQKLDIKALPKPENSRPEIDIALVPPENNLQRNLIKIWCDVLGFQEIGINDPFLDLGGDSLLGMQVVNRVSKQLNRRISAAPLMQNSSIRQLASFLTEAQEIDEKTVLQSQKNKPQLTPLTHAQWGLWYLWKLDPDNPFYTAQGSVHLEGCLCKNSLEHAWRQTVHRHQVLRTRFVMESGSPVQTFNDYSAEEIVYSDLSHLSKKESVMEMDRINTRLGKHAYHLENDHLLQVQLFKLSDSHYEFVFTYQEIIFDLWGFAIIIRDLLEFYASPKANTEPKNYSDDIVAEIDFSDYAVWEQQNIIPKKLQSENQFWREHLVGQLPILDLPFDYPRQSEPDYAGDAKSFMLDREVSRKLKQLSRDNGVTLFTTILSAFYVFLRQYSNQQDIIIGSPIANRSLSGTENVVGWFLNMLPMRLTMDNDISFSELLKHSNQIVVDAITNADYPFRWMLEWANTPRDKTISPVFQVMFNWQNLPQTSPEIEGLQVSSSEVDSTFKKYDLALYAQEHLDRIYLQLSYLTALFKPSKIKRMLDNFVLTLEKLCDEPEQKISRAGKISPNEKNWLLEDLNDTHCERGYSQNIVTLFEKQVMKSPLKTALIDEDKTINYSQLNLRANKIANILLKRGVKQSDRITVCLERSSNMVATLLAVSKIGAIHVALDSHFPVSRLNEICQDTNAKVHICQLSTDRLENRSVIKLCLDSDSNEIESSGGKNPDNPSGPDDIFNIVFTSGSTGKSKGVLISYRAVLNRLMWMWSKYPFKSDDVAVLQKSYAIVASNWEIFGALLAGRPTLILQTEEVIDGAKFYQQCRSKNVSYLLGSPALISNVLNQAEQNIDVCWQSLRLVTTSAEAVSPEMVIRWRKQFPQVPLLNLFGATECSSNATCYDTAELLREDLYVPIGRPIDNTKVYIVDPQLNLIPKGATGELCVAGDCLANGYLNFPDLSAQNFVSNPFISKSDDSNRYSTLYRTGDLARINEDGQIELVGRKDMQIKIRGFRVELGDLESVLLEHPKVKKCVATTFEGAGKIQALAVFIETEGAVVESTVLKDFLRQRLPDYMLPAQINLIEKIPLTPAGKPDRAVLPEMSCASEQTEFVAARSSAEEVVLDVWSKILEVEYLGINGDFFDAGGHSLLATAMVSRLLDIFQIELPIRSIFDAPTVSKLVAGPLSDALGGRQLVEDIAEIWLSIETQG